jgi:hypothetical protein
MADRTEVVGDHPAKDQSSSTDAEDAYERVLRLQAQLRRGGTDAHIERELVHLRLAAAQHLAPTTGRDQWPPGLGDPFPNLRGVLPEIAPDRLEPAVVGGGVVHHGAVIVRGLLGTDDVARVRDGMDRTYQDRLASFQQSADPGEGDDGSTPDPTGPIGSDGWFAPFRPKQPTAGQKGKEHLIRLVDAPRLLADLIDTYRRVGLLPLVQQYLGEPPVFTANKSVLRYVRTPRMLPTDYHQDGRFMGDDVRAINIWVTLDDCGRHAPSLDVVPRREAVIHPTGNGANGFDWTLSADEVTGLAADTPVTRLELQAGDAVIFDQFLVHRSAHSRHFEGLRRAVEWWFYAPSRFPPQYQSLRA